MVDLDEELVRIHIEGKVGFLKNKILRFKKLAAARKARISRLKQQAQRAREIAKSRGKAPNLDSVAKAIDREKSALDVLSKKQKEAMAQLKAMTKKEIERAEAEKRSAKRTAVGIGAFVGSVGAYSAHKRSKLRKEKLKRARERQRARRR